MRGRFPILRELLRWVGISMHGASIASLAMVWTLHAEGKIHEDQQRIAPMRQSSEEGFRVCSVLGGWKGRRTRRRKNEMKNRRHNLDILHSNNDHNHGKL